MIKPLTSLRFFFAFFVFLSHLSFLKDSKFCNIFDDIFSEGFLGVSFFFILSGFILALNYKDKIINKKISLRNFYIARVARIYPLHLFTLLLSIPFFYKSLSVLLLNLFLMQSYFPKKNIFFSYNAPSWSISSEFFFYALFPLLIFIFAKINYLTKIFTFFVFTSAIILLNILLPENKVHYWVYISPFTRIFDFILGIFLFELFILFKNKKLTHNYNCSNIFEVISLFTLLLFFLLKDYFPINFRYSIYYWIPMCLIIFSFALSFLNIKEKNTIFNLLSHRGFVYLGEISFAFYLLHYIVIDFIIKINELVITPFAQEFLPLLIFSITLILSVLAFEKIEKPFNKKIKNFLA